MESEREGDDIVEVDALIVHPAVYFLFYLYYFTMPSRKRKKRKGKRKIEGVLAARSQLKLCTVRWF